MMISIMGKGCGMVVLLGKRVWDGSAPWEGCGMVLLGKGCGMVVLLEKGVWDDILGKGCGIVLLGKG